MLHTKITSSSSSNSTFAFDTSYSIQTNTSQEKIHSSICLHEKNFNRNANDIDQKNKFLNRLVQSSIDITTNNFYSSINRENSHENNEAIRIESALMASDCSHSLLHVSRTITGINECLSFTPNVVPQIIFFKSPRRVNKSVKSKLVTKWGF
jgi:hypothetical protein